MQSPVIICKMSYWKWNPDFSQRSQSINYLSLLTLLKEKQQQEKKPQKQRSKQAKPTNQKKTKTQNKKNQETFSNT